jgi:hypothetical protein
MLVGRGAVGRNRVEYSLPAECFATSPKLFEGAAREQGNDHPERGDCMTETSAARLFIESDLPTGADHSNTSVLENTARAALDCRAGRNLTDADWRQARSKLLELFTILRGWDQKARKPAPGLATVEALCQRET